MEYYSYMRVSTQTQAEANGVQMQDAVITKYCEEKGIKLSGTFQDLGISGTIADRDGILELLAVVQPGDVIIVQNTSRLWRSDTAKVILKMEIEKKKAHVLSIEQPNYDIYSKDPNDFLINSIMEILDQYDKMQISMKLNKGRKAKAKKGSKACGVLAYGYSWSNSAEVIVNREQKSIVIDLFNKYLEVGSLQKLADYCRVQGYKTGRGNDFSKASLKALLNNKFYIGIVVYNDNEIQGTHETFINKSLFYQVQAKLSGLKCVEVA